MTGWSTLLLAHGLPLAGAVTAAGWAVHLRRRLRRAEEGCAGELRLLEEFQRYAELDLSPMAEDDVAAAQPQPRGAATQDALRALGLRVCRAVARHSAFPRVALLLADPEGQLRCVSSAGVDDLTVAALNAWGGSGAESAMSGTGRTYPFALGEWARFDPEISEWARSGRRERRRWRRALAVAIRTEQDRLCGALVVCADGASRRSGQPLEREMGALEALASRLGTAVAQQAQAERMRQAQVQAATTRLAGDLARALEPRLAAVLGFAELIAGTAGDPRVRQDAELIRTEATRMRRTLESLQPAALPETSPMSLPHKPATELRRVLG